MGAMMKKILIINKSFETGGIQSSLVNMVNELQKEYQVDLFLYDPEGPMKERISPHVRILSPSWQFQALGMPFKKVITSGNIRMILFRVFATAWGKIVNNRLPIACAIRSQKRMTGYDMAIAYHQEQRKHATISGFARVAAECVNAKMKIAWLHYDNQTLDLDSAYNNPFYEKMDRIVCVSRALAENYVKQFPSFQGKTDYCYSFVDYDALRQKSLETQSVPFPAGKTACFSACRLTKEKALVRAVKCLAPVFREHPELVWYIAGDGVERKPIEEAIADANMGEQIVLLGQQNNPYAYMRNADLVMNLSYHEAAPMVFLEAKALATPVFATRTVSADELLENGIGAVVCENSEDAIQSSFRALIQSPERIVEMKRYLEQHQGNNDRSMARVREWLNAGELRKVQECQANVREPLNNT